MVLGQATMSEGGRATAFSQAVASKEAGWAPGLRCLPLIC